MKKNNRLKPVCESFKKGSPSEKNKIVKDKYVQSICKYVKERSPQGHPEKDKHVQSVCKSFKERSIQGQLKYGTTLERTDIDTLGWVQHTQEELMDAILYLERLKADLRTNKTLKNDK